VVGLAIVYLLGRFVRLRLSVDREFVKTSLQFSFGNYIAQLFLNFTYLVLPMMILAILGPDEAAKYYIAYTIGNFLLQVPDAVGMSLFVEGSNGESMRKNVLRAAAAMYAVLIPGVIFMFLFGGRLLALFSKDYTESITLLRLFALVSLFFANYCLMVPVQNVRMNVKRIMHINVIIFVLFLGMSYLFLTHIGIVGVGLALLLTFMIVDVIIIGLAKVEGWF
jgi:O-antigen/teichoic acid export membrane protein